MNVLLFFALQIRMAVFAAYIKSCGIVPFVTALIFYSGYLVAQVFTNVWLSEWSNDQPVNGSQDIGLRDLRLGVYGGLGGLQG